MTSTERPTRGMTVHRIRPVHSLFADISARPFAKNVDEARCLPCYNRSGSQSTRTIRSATRSAMG